eukprot:761452-Hanusia_phi.AAC.1
MIIDRTDPISDPGLGGSVSDDRTVTRAGAPGAGPRPGQRVGPVTGGPGPPPGRGAQRLSLSLTQQVTR